VARAIDQVFQRLGSQGKKAFIPFITSGDPDLETTIRLVPELERAGSSIVELGIPFSDPLADGPTIQRSSERALRMGYRLADHLDAIKQIRRQTNIPVVIFSYFNPILQYGAEKFARDARLAGADGVLVTDLTPEESEDYRLCLEENELDSIFLVAPTSSAERVALIARCCRGFVYLVSRTGVTGAQETISDAVFPTLSLIRRHTNLPVAVGFGISRPEQVRRVWKAADGAVVGSAIVSEIEKHREAKNLVSCVGDFCRWLTGGVNAPQADC
jgi:tryptophan synthase alpha chain